MNEQEIKAFAFPFRICVTNVRSKAEHTYKTYTEAVKDALVLQRLNLQGYIVSEVTGEILLEFH